MAYFEWADDMVIDGGIIDADHRLLVDQVNELHTATSQGEGQHVVQSLLHRLINSTEEHLRNEENVMAQMGFPDLDKHKIGHAYFMNELRTLEKRMQDGSFTVAAQLSAVLRDWLSLHIRRNDKDLLRFHRRKEREQGRNGASKQPASMPALPSAARQLARPSKALTKA